MPIESRVPDHLPTFILFWQNASNWNQFSLLSDVCFDDIYFIGNAEVTYRSEHYRIKDGLIEFHKGFESPYNHISTHGEYTVFNYSDTLCSAVSHGYLGMMDYENHYNVHINNEIVDSVVSYHVHEPFEQRRLGIYSISNKKTFNRANIGTKDITIKEDSIKIGDITIIYLHGIPIEKKNQNDVLLRYRYCEFDSLGNWLQREVLSNENKLIEKQTRVINYN